MVLNLIRVIHIRHDSILDEVFHNRTAMLIQCFVPMWLSHLGHATWHLLSANVRRKTVDVHRRLKLYIATKKQQKDAAARKAHVSTKRMVPR